MVAEPGLPPVAAVAAVLVAVDNGSNTSCGRVHAYARDDSGCRGGGVRGSLPTAVIVRAMTMLVVSATLAVAAGFDFDSAKKEFILKKT